MPERKIIDAHVFIPSVRFEITDSGMLKKNKKQSTPIDFSGKGILPFFTIFHRLPPKLIRFRPLVDGESGRQRHHTHKTDSQKSFDTLDSSNSNGRDQRSPASFLKWRNGRRQAGRNSAMKR